MTATPNASGCEDALLSAIRGRIFVCVEPAGTSDVATIRRTGTPAVTSLEPDEDWSWCDIDELVLELG
jgi:hypothetical protein